MTGIRQQKHFLGEADGYFLQIVNLIHKTFISSGKKVISLNPFIYRGLEIFFQTNGRLQKSFFVHTYNKKVKTKDSDCARLFNRTTAQYRISNGVWGFGFQMSLERHLLCMIVRYTLIQLRIQLIWVHIWVWWFWNVKPRKGAVIKPINFLQTKSQKMRIVNFYYDIVHGFTNVYGQCYQFFLLSE